MASRLPPHDLNAEKCVIGSCLIAPPDSIPAAQLVITNDGYFYDQLCLKAWRLICEVSPDRVDLITMSGQIPLSFLNECIDLVPSAANLPVWLETLTAKFIQRTAISFASTVLSAGYESTDPFSLLDMIERCALTIRPHTKTESEIRSLVSAAINRIERRCQQQGITGLTTGLTDLDRHTDGLHAGEMIVIAGLPSTGKTALAVNMAVRNAFDKVPTAIFTAEMQPIQLVIRSICSESRTNFHRVTFNDAPKMVTVTSKLANAPLYIESANGMSIGQVKALARRLKQKRGIRLVVVDYIQLLSGVGDNREQEISSVSKGLKSIAIELDLPVIALSQLTDDGKLRESRAIGQDADCVWKLTNDGEWQPTIQPIKLRVEKGRDSATGEVKLTFFKEYTRFENAALITNEDKP